MGFPAKFSFSAKNLRRQNDTSALLPLPVIFRLLHLHTMQIHNEGFNTPSCRALLSAADFLTCWMLSLTPNQLY